MTFARWLRAQLDAGDDRSVRWLVDRTTGLTVQGVYALLREPRKEWVQRSTVEAIARGLGVSDATVYGEVAYSIGLDRPGAASGFASLLPPWVDQLKEGDKIAVRDVVLRLGHAHGLTD